MLKNIDPLLTPDLLKVLAAIGVCTAANAWLVARLAEDTLYGDAAGFDRVMSWFEAPGRSSSLWRFVLPALVGKLLMTEPNPPGFTERLALAALRIVVAQRVGVVQAQRAGMAMLRSMVGPSTSSNSTSGSPVSSSSRSAPRT